MHNPVLLSLALPFLAATSVTHAFQNPLLRPPLGWSSWNTFGCRINATLVEESIRALAASPLHAAGYDWVWIDDCWTTCNKPRPGNKNQGCAEPGPRSADGRIKPDPLKFPHGFKPLTALAHSLSIKMGIYTSVSAVTCGGYMGSLYHEALDAATFVEWGFDLVKHDTCGTDYSVHDGGLQNATERMREGIFEAGQGSVVYYLDSGNPTSPQRVFNPHQHHVHDREALAKLAVRPEELVWYWTARWADGKGPHLLKSWFDRKDSWASVLTNVQNQIRTAEYQRCGHFHNPDMLTIGMGGQTEAEYRSQFFLYAVLGAPMIMGNDIRLMDNFTVSLVTQKEVLAVAQDSDCVMGSLARNSDATETWIKPLADGSFAVVLLNKGAMTANATVIFDGDWTAEQDFYPAKFPAALVRDLHAKKDLGLFAHSFSLVLAPHDSAIVKVKPLL